MRSSVVPHTMASETAQNTNWKNHFASIVASDRPMIGHAFCGSPKSRRKNPCVPITWPIGPPNANAKPTAQYRSPAIEKFVRIFAITVPAFLARENPISRNAKPACMNITKQPATITQIELIPTESGMPFLLPTASIRSARGRDMQPPWLDVLMVDFGCPSDIGQRSEMQAGVFAPRSKTAAYAAIRGVSHAGQVPARALGGIGPRLPGDGPWQRLGRGDRARARNVVLGGRRARNRRAGARRLGHQGDADGR